MEFDNFGDALVTELNELMTDGDTVSVRGNVTMEIRAELIKIWNPLERIICVPARNNSIFATVAETLWVLTGRNDLDFISRYLPRAGLFSDDGKVWRAGYGKRIRHFQNDIVYNGVDQLSKCIRILADDPESRQAVITIFDPTRDFVKSKDIPCTNWLHFMIRDGKLDLSVVIRSNDIIWGASGINWFEWSVLQDLVASTLGVEVGVMNYFADSLHIYEHHFTKAIKIIEEHIGFTDMYEFGAVPSEFNTKFSDLDTKLMNIFADEDEMAAGKFVYDERIGKYSNDGFLFDCVVTLAIGNALKHGNMQEAVYLLNEMANDGKCDFRYAILENLCRKQELPSEIILHENEKKFLRQFKNTNFVETIG